MLTFGSNPVSINQQFHLANTQRSMTKVMERLSTGLRINSAADDPSAIGMMERLNADIRGIGQAEENIQQSLSLLGSLESGLNTILEMVQQYREVAVEAANGTVTNYTPYTTSINAIRSEIDRLSNEHNFNGIKLMDGTNASLTFQIGWDNSANHRMTISGIFADVDAAALSLATVTNNATANTAITNADTAITTLTNRLTEVGAYYKTLETHSGYLQNTKENYTAAYSNIRDADIAAESATLTKLEVLAQAGAAMLAQANQLPAVGLSLLN